MTRLLELGLAVALTFMLTGCASRHHAEGHGNSPTYGAGYTDGCATASARGAGEMGGETRDKSLYQADKDYRSGWRAGYASCNTTYVPNPLDNPFGKPPGS